MAERTITIPYTPRNYFNELHNTKHRWIVCVSHRRSGKTVATLNHLIRDAILKPLSRYAYIAPTYKQAKNVAWDYLKFYSKDIPGIKTNEAELRIDYPTGSRITLFGADNPDSLRGLALWGVVFDEYSQQPSNIFSEIIRPSLADNQGYAIWIGTPKGKNEFYRLFEHSKIDENWLSMLLTVDDTKIIPQSELEDARKVMNEDEFNQEWYCSFEASIKGAYYNRELSRAREEDRICNVPYEPSIPVHTFWDLGISDYTSIGFFQLVGKEKRMIDFYESHGYGLDHYAKIIKEKPYCYGSHNFPHDVEVRELGTGKSRREILESLGIRVDIVPNIPVADGINSGRLTFSGLWIDKNKCSSFIDAISQYKQEWDDKNGMFRDKPLHDWTSHAADMYRYFSVGVDRLININDFEKIMSKNESKYISNPYK
jgi:phage terminase large subunit